MKRFFSSNHCRRSRLGFTLVESVLSVGIMSFGFLALAPLLALGLNGARLAKENRATAQIGATLVEEAKQGTLPNGTLYFDSVRAPSTAAQAVYTAKVALTNFAPGSTNSGPLTRLTLSIASVDMAGAARTYADVFPTPPTP